MKVFASDDTRAQSIQIGVVILFAFAVLGVTVYQTQIVNTQNKAAEQSAYQVAQQDFVEMSNTIQESGLNGQQGSVAFQIGVNYNPRAFFLNPAPSSSSVRTTAEQPVTIRNAESPTRETSDYWDGSVWSEATRDVVFTPAYTYATQPEHRITAGGVGYINNSNTYVVNSQSLISGTQINLVTTTGELDATNTKQSIRARPAADQTRAVTLTDTGTPIEISIPTQLDAATWENKLLAEELTTNGGHVVGVTDTANGVTIELESGVSYAFRSNQVRLSTTSTSADSTGLSPAYITPANSISRSAQVGGRVNLQSEVRSKYNTPVTDVPITTSIESGSDVITLVESSAQTDAGGVTDAVIQADQPGEAVVRVQYGTAGSQQYVEYTVTVESAGGGGSTGAYTVSWSNPNTNAANDGAVTACTTETCTWDPSRSGGDLELTAGLSDTISGFTTEFGVNNTAQGSVSPASATTDGTGNSSTTLSNGVQYGAVKVYVASGGSSDVISVIIDDDALNSVTAEYTYAPDPPDGGEQMTFDASATSAPDGETITQYEWDWNGDGTYETSTASAVTQHTFASAGTYDVTLRVTSDSGEQSTTTQSVTVNAAPNAFYSFSPDPAEPSQQISFDASGSNDPDGTITQYEWDWNGDGAYEVSSTDPTETHAYTSSGTYDATLRVTDDTGSTSTQTRQVTVASSPSVDSLVASDASGGPNTRVRAEWSVSDPDGGLQQVTLEIRNENTGTITDSATITVSGGTASGSNRLDGTRGTGGATYTVILTVENVNGITTSETDSTPTS